MTDVPKFHRWLDPADKRSVRKLSIDADEGERVALAAWLDIPRVQSLHAEFAVTRTGTEAAQVTGAFVADVELVCGVSLEQFAQHLSGAFAQEFRRPQGTARLVSGREIDVTLDDEEIGEWGPQGIDLGALLAEELSLAVPDFPVKSGAQFDAPEEVDDSEQRPNPFTVLARLKDGDT